MIEIPSVSANRGGHLQIASANVYFRADRLSRPAPGRSLGQTVSVFEEPLRNAVEVLSLSDPIPNSVFRQIFDCTVYGAGAVVESPVERLAWFLVNAALIRALACRTAAVDDIDSSLAWFLGDSNLAQAMLAGTSRAHLLEANRALRRVSATSDLRDLLPYLIEPHGHVTRGQLQAESKAHQIRRSKKAAGVYYTPTDVADFMVATLATSGKSPGRWLDPACGTGVFLRAVIDHYLTSSEPHLDEDTLVDFCKTRLFGIDRSALATDSASFVLLAECASHEVLKASAVEIWALFKRNLVCMDSLRLSANQSMSLFDPHYHTKSTIGALFPSLSSHRFDHLVMNPPYASVMVDSDLKQKWISFAGMPVGADGDAHLAFIEMSWHLVNKAGNSAAILPISVGTNTNAAHRRLRSALLAIGGKNQFLFFDREPQALFGEDIKTRNLIQFRFPQIGDVTIETSRMLKWVAAQRPSIFTNARTVRVCPRYCARFIPKLGSTIEAQTYSVLRSAQNSALNTAGVLAISSITMSDAMVSRVTASRLLVSGTAYNFISCFFCDGIPEKSSNAYSASKLHLVTAIRDEYLWAAYALLTSRISFWLWHTEGDGFHVSGQFLKALPLWSVLRDEASANSLIGHGKTLWQFARSTLVGSVNRGKQTYSFHSGFDHPNVAKVERIIIDKMNMDTSFSMALDEFIASTVSINGSGRRLREENSLEKTPS